MTRHQIEESSETDLDDETTRLFTLLADVSNPDVVDDVMVVGTIVEEVLFKPEKSKVEVLALEELEAVASISNETAVVKFELLLSLWPVAVKLSWPEPLTG